MANEVPKGSPGATIIAEEERLYGQVQARVAMGEEDDGRPQIGASDLDARSALAARPDLRSARRGSAAAGRADDAARGAQARGSAAAARCRSTSRRRTSRIMRLQASSGKSRDVLVGKRGFIDRAVERADRRLAQRAGVAHLLPLRRGRRLRGGDRRPPRRGRRRGAPQRLDRARATCAASARRRART